MPDGHFSRDGQRRLLMVALGRQRVGKTALLNTIVQYFRTEGNEIEVWNAGQHVPFHSAPDASSQTVGFAGSQVAVRYPTHEVNGFLEALFPTGSTAWIAADLVRPYHSNLDPTAKCIPVIMANGKQGFSYPH
jgi:hypothetical protein